MTLSQYLLELPRPLFGKPSKRLYDKLQAQDFPHIHEELIRQLEELLELPFVSLSGSGNLCFIQSDEILPEFRTSFHQLHLLDAIYASSLQTNSRILLLAFFLSILSLIPSGNLQSMGGS